MGGWILDDDCKRCPMLTSRLDRILLTFRELMIRCLDVVFGSRTLFLLGLGLWRMMLQTMKSVDKSRVFLARVRDLRIVFVFRDWICFLVS